MKVYWKSGFTLIEVLLVMAILGVLAAIITGAINPARQLANARDAQRLSDVYSILNAVHQYAADNEGMFPEVLTTEELEICITGELVCEGMYVLDDLTDDDTYLISMPVDPLCQRGDCENHTGTGYFISLTTNGRVTVTAPLTELQDPFTIAR